MNNKVLFYITFVLVAIASIISFFTAHLPGNKGGDQTAVLFLFLLLITIIVATIGVVKTFKQDVSKIYKFSSILIIPFCIVIPSFFLFLGDEYHRESTREKNLVLTKKYKELLIKYDKANNTAKFCEILVEKDPSLFEFEKPFIKKFQKKFRKLLKDEKFRTCALKGIKALSDKKSLPTLIALANSTGDDSILDAISHLDYDAYRKLEQKFEKVREQEWLRKTADERLQYGLNLREKMLNDYANIKVKVYGKYNTKILLYNWPFDEAVVKFVEDTYVDKRKLIDKGFKKLTFKSTTGESYYYDWN